MFKASLWSPGFSELKPLGYFLIPQCYPKILILVPREHLFYLVLCDMSPEPAVLIQGKNMVSWELHKRLGQSVSKSGPNTESTCRDDACFISNGISTCQLPSSLLSHCISHLFLLSLVNPIHLLWFVCNSKRRILWSSRRMLWDVKKYYFPPHPES